MKITISVNGRFHAFDLAAQMHKRGHLQRLITTYPYFKVAEWGIPREKVVSLLPIELMRRGKSKIGAHSRFNSSLKMVFDFAASRKIPRDTDLFIGWSGSSLQSIRRANGFGAKTIVERGSSHIETQRDILEEEFRRAGIPMAKGAWTSIRTELQEYRLADRVEVPSSFAANTFIEKGFDSTKIIRSGRGVNLQQFRSFTKEDEDFRVIFTGNLSLRKGVEYLKKLAAELNKKKNIQTWHIGGRSSEVNRIYAAGDLQSIESKGSFPQSKLSWYYSQGNVFVLPSVEEGLAMVQVQAMACGLPLICTPNTGGEDLITDGVEGFVVPIRDPEAIREKIMYLYHNPEICKRMGEAALQKVESGFTWDDYGDLVEKEYQRLVDGS